MMMLDGDENDYGIFEMGSFAEIPAEIKPLTINNTSVSELYKCQTCYANKLCIYDVAYKLEHTGNYDIGGTYIMDKEPHMWFYYTTSFCPGVNYLLNLFVCLRKSGSIAIGISESNELTHKKIPGEECTSSMLPDHLTWYKFSAQQPNEHYYIKTFCFSEKDVKELEQSTLYIPLNLDVSLGHKLNMDIVKRIKLEHDFGKLFSKELKTDFIVQSASGKQYHQYKIVLAAHSSVLRNMIKDTNLVSINISDEDMEFILEFIYTGTIKSIHSFEDCVKLLQIAEMFQLQNLFLLLQYAFSDQLNVKNAVQIAVISEKYKLNGLQANAFHYIKNHPDVLDSDDWKSLENATIPKKLFEFVQNYNVICAIQSEHKHFKRSIPGRHELKRCFSHWK